MLRTPFGFGSTAFEVLEGLDLSGKRMIVTGGNGGIGKETVRALAMAGADVTITTRSGASPQVLADELGGTGGTGRITVRELDLASLSSVRRFVAEWTGPLDALVNNAGIMALPELTRTQEGREMQFATNFLGHFALTCGLHPSLAACGGRVVSVASTGSLFGPILWDDVDFRFIRYDPLLAYAQSKTACILMAVAIADRWKDSGITCNALHPGAIATNLQRHTGGLQTPEPYRKTPEQGAATSVLLATSSLLDGISGRYFEDCNEAAAVEARPDGRIAGVAPYAMDPANADRLWDLARTMIASRA